MTAPEDQNGLREALARVLDPEKWKSFDAVQGWRDNTVKSVVMTWPESSLRMADALIAGPLASLIAERDAAVEGKASAEGYVLILLEEKATAETELDEERQESARLALAVTEGQAEIARLRDGMERIASFPENYDKDGQSWGVGYAFYAVRKIARATLSPKEQP